MPRKVWVGLVLLVLGFVHLPTAHAQTWRVGVQAGHWKSAELPDELKRLRTSTGTAAAGVKEWQVNLDIAQRTAGFLRDAGIAVDVLPATVPVNYHADAFVAIHADGSSSTRLSGFKIASQWRAWDASTALVDALRTDYGAATGLAWDGGRITSNMRGYYAFSSGRFDHTISNTTPGAILEMGYLTNAHDRGLMLNQADRLAKAISDGIIRFLHNQPANGWPSPPPMPIFRGTVIAASAPTYSGPGEQYAVGRRLRHNQSVLIERAEGDWLKLMTYRPGQNERWVNRNALDLHSIGDESPESP